MAIFTDRILVIPTDGVTQRVGAGDTIELSTGHLIVGGNLTVTGTKFTNSAETVLVSDNHMFMNAGYTTAAGQTGGLVVNYLPLTGAGNTDTIAASAVFTAGIDTTSDPTVTTTGSGTFTAADIIQISGTENGGENDGLYEVQGHTGTTLTIKSTSDGLTDQVEDFTDGQFIANAADTSAATITQVTVSVLRAKASSGVWETGSGSVTGITFSDLATAAGTTLQSAYDAGQTITLLDTSGDLVFTLDDAATAADIQITDSGGDYLFTDAANNQIILGSAANDVNVPDNTQLEVGTGADFSILHNAVDTLITSATGDLTIDNTNTAGSTINILGTDTSATDFQVQNNSASPLLTVNGAGQVDIPGNIDATGGIDIDADSVSLTLGAGQDFTILHDGTNTVFDNIHVTGATVFQLGTDTSATEFRIINNSSTELFGIDGAGSAVLAATMIGDSFAITESSIAKTGASIDISWGAVAATTARGIDLDFSGMTSLTSATDQFGANLSGETNAGAGLSVGLNVDANWDVGIYNEGAMRFGEISNPTGVANKGFIFVKDDSTDTELFYLDDSSNVVQITRDGQLAVASAEIVTLDFTNGEGTDITLGDVVAISGATTVTWADATTADVHRPFGIAKATAATATTVTIQTNRGSVVTTSTIAGFSTLGDIVYLSETGTTANTLTTTAPTASGSTIYRTGYAVTSTTMVWDPQFIAINP